MTNQVSRYRHSIFNPGLHDRPTRHFMYLTASEGETQEVQGAVVHQLTKRLVVYTKVLKQMAQDMIYPHLR